MPENEVADPIETLETDQQEPSAPAPPPRRRLTNAAKAIIANRREANPSFERHSRKCQICSHPDMEELEDEFINWASAHWIAEAFELSDESTIYRHARAAGLDVLRRENLGVVVEKVLQEVDHLEAPNVAEVLRAVRILSRLNRQGQWVGPAATTESPRGVVACPPRRALAEAANRQTYEELEVGLTRTKQGTDADSNRRKT